MLFRSVSLSCFDDKRFILDGGIETLPLGHYQIRDVGVTNDILDEPEWGYEEMPASPTWDQMIGNDPVNTTSQIFQYEPQNAQVRPITPVTSVEFNQTSNEPMSLTQQLMEEWSPPDPGLYQRSYSDSELEEVVDLDASFQEQSPERNPFVIDEADEEPEDGQTGEDDELSSENDCVIVEQSNAIEELDFDNCLSDDDFINWPKRAKIRRLLMESDSESE